MANVAKRSGKKPRKPRRRKASYRKPKRKVDRKLQSSQSLNPTSRLSGGPGSAGPWPMNPYGVSFGGLSMAGLRQQEALRPKDQNSVMTSRERDMKNVVNNHIHLNGLEFDVDGKSVSFGGRGGGGGGVVAGPAVREVR